MHTPGKKPGRRTPVLAGAVLACLASWLLLGSPGGLFQTPDTGLLRLGESATPDSETLAADPDPLGHRARLLDQLGVTSWHAAGRHGRGVKVAVLDSGFAGYRAHLGKALPARVTTRSFRGDGNLEARQSQHGILCGEVIHAIAPEAEILFANWEPEHPERFLEAVRWARRSGARVLSCSVIMPSWSDAEGHGWAHAELTRLLAAGAAPGDGLLFASAGNTALRHWSGSFRDPGTGWHEWVPGCSDNALRPWGKDRVSVEMCWQPGDTFELSVRDAATSRQIGRSRPPRAGTPGCAVVAFAPRHGRAYQVRIRRLGPHGGPGTFHVVALGGSLRHARAEGSIPFPGDGPEVVAVGAVDASGRRLAYSSCGREGGLLKPDLTAPVPFPSLWRTRPFAGTSAAAPQAAALAALLWSHHPDWNAGQVRAALCHAACRRSPGRPDEQTGFGTVHLPAP